MANTLIIMSDEHNPRYSSPYGHPFVKTPNMQALADRGTVFDNAYCNSPLCCPSRASFMSGLYVHKHEAFSNCTVNVRRDFPAWAGELTQRGVHTTHTGKMDSYCPTEEMGFDEVLIPGNRSPAGQDMHLHRDPVMERIGGAERAHKFGPRADFAGPDLKTMEAALGWLDGRLPQIRQPWVLSVSLVKPHFPHYVSPELWDMYADHADMPEIGREAESANHLFARDLRHHFQADRFTEEQVRGLRQGYYGLVTFIDQQIGRLVEALRRLNVLESTNIIYTSDHGEMLGKFGMWWKCTMYDDSAKIPVIAAGPDFAKGKRVKTPVSLMDVQASLYASAGVKMTAGREGRALQEIPDNDPERVVFSEYHAHGTRAGSYMIRKGDWKLIFCVGAESLLFNMAEDPEELKNLATQRPEKAAELEAHLRGICDPEKVSDRALMFQKAQLQDVAKMAGAGAV